ncbi:MAG: fumarylacetoacetate hydrolase family protein [Bacteroidales bacterium]|nr:fumarylacetoacetate hydrolase family protein [Bacteroidales bacterium]
MKIIGVGWNYPDHNKEMNRALLPEQPVIFSKPDTALLKDGKPFFIPDFSNQVEYEAEIVLKINRLGKNIAPKFAHRYYNEITIGIDFTARDLQKKQKESGGPWEICKAFDGSAALGKFITIENAGEIQNINFKLDINGNTVQSGNTSEMIFQVDQIIAYISKFFTLKIGDIIFTGTPSGVGPVKINDRLEGFIGETKLLDFYVK